MAELPKDKPTVDSAFYIVGILNSWRFDKNTVVQKKSFHQEGEP
jgi:hypothetical protein